MKYRSFIFQDYFFDAEAKTLYLNYSLDDTLVFAETYRFNFQFTKYDPKLLEVALTTLFYMAGVSYYKTYLPPKIIPSKQHPLDPSMAGFFDRTYQQGLREFFMTNNLPIDHPINFPVTSPAVTSVHSKPREGLLVGLGGGKDSLVTVELLRQQGVPFSTWSVGHQQQLQPLVKSIGSNHYWVERVWDRQLLDLNGRDALNGHVPISAILASVGMVVGVLSGTRDIVVSNEHSANEPTMFKNHLPVNHQYSKSQLFEEDFQQYLQHVCGNALRYYSFLRPLSELKIAELFSTLGFDKYQEVFSSCNRAFTHDSHHISWCGECPKCAFVFLALTPFIEKDKLQALWDGKNLLQDTHLEKTYQQLLGITGDKPFECVGEIKESRSAMRLASKIYANLSKKYAFDIPAKYSYKTQQSHAMPKDIEKIFRRAMDELLPSDVRRG